MNEKSRYKEVGDSFGVKEKIVSVEVQTTGNHTISITFILHTLN